MYLQEDIEVDSLAGWKRRLCQAHPVRKPPKNAKQREAEALLCQLLEAFGAFGPRFCMFLPALLANGRVAGAAGKPGR